MSNKNYDALTLYFERGVDLMKRRLYFGDADVADGDEVDFCSVSIAIRAIDKMLDISNKPVEIHMTSYGGDVDHMHSLVDKIQESPCQFYFYGRGVIQSAAVWIMLACDQRYVSKNTRIMVHHGYEGFEGSSTDKQIDSEESRYYMEKSCEMLASRSYYDKDFWEMVLQRDAHMSPEEALQAGLIKGIIPYRKRGNFRKGDALQSPPSRQKMKAFAKKLLKRVKLDKVVKDIKIQIPKEQFEKIEEYDNSTQELKDLNLVPDSKESK